MKNVKKTKIIEEDKKEKKDKKKLEILKKKDINLNQK